MAMPSTEAASTREWRVISQNMKMSIKLGGLSLVLGMAIAPVIAQQTTAPAAAAAPAPAPTAKGDAAKGKAVFDAASCSACHALEAAGAMGEVGPSLDHNAKLTHDLIVARVGKGQGDMPPYAGQLSEADIENVAAYVLSAAAK